MTHFHNEHLPEPTDEESPFFRDLRRRLGLGRARGHGWTVDRLKRRALVRTGYGEHIDVEDEEYWSFIDGARFFRFTTSLVRVGHISNHLVYVERRFLHFLVGPGHDAPDEGTLKLIRDAMLVYKDCGIASTYTTCSLVLRDKAGTHLWPVR